MLTRRSKSAIIRGVLTKKSLIYVQFALCKRCNLRCGMCGATSARKGEKELNLNEIEKLSNLLAKLKAGVIILTGGEPFLREDLPDIVRVFSKKGFDTRIQTNGVLATEEKIKAIVKAGISEVTISLDSLNPEKQDYINNVKGTWHKIIKSISLFSEYLPKKGNMPILNTVVSRLNIKEIPNIVKFATKIGYYSSIIPVHLHSSSISKKDFIVRTDSKPFRFTPKEYGLIDKLYSRLIEMKKQGYNVHNSAKFLKESPDFLKYNKINWKCDSPNLYFSISPEGLFLPCVDIPYSKSMLDEDFVKTYHSKEFRKKITELVKKCPGCMYACYPEITYLCRDPSIFIERIFQGLKISRKKRTPISYEGSLEIIKKIRKENTWN